MRVQCVSDLHTEFGIVERLHDSMIKTKADVLILAGDIACHNTITYMLCEIQELSGKEIIFVPGNHCYYGTTRKTLDKELYDIKNLNRHIHVLIEKDICIGNVCFIGSTGWWDGSGGSITETVKHGLNDFRLIYDLMDEGNLDGIVWGRKAQTYLSSRMHWLRHNMPDMKLCVVTHHYPHYLSLAPEFAGSPINTCFGNRWEWMIERYQPEFWIHGHTHNVFDYIVEGDDPTKKTRIVCNPQGYPHEYVSNYNPSLVIEM